MSVFVDTSALYAIASERDANHSHAASSLRELIAAETLVTHNYVALETISLVHARHGRGPLARVRALLELLEHVWVDADLHGAALDRLTAGGRSGPSFVDFLSFDVMDRLGIEEAFAFDEDFVKAGYRLVGR